MRSIALILVAVGIFLYMAAGIVDLYLASRFTGLSQLLMYAAIVLILYDIAQSSQFSK